VKATGVVVVATAGLIRQGVVRIVDLLELACAGGTLGGIGGDPIGVMLQGGFLVGFSDLGLRGGCGNLENTVEIRDGICKVR